MSTTAPRLVHKVLEPPAVQGKVPPNCLDAEGAVLATIIQRRDAIDLVLDILRPEDFYSEANGNIFQACLDLARRGTAIDTVSIGRWLSDRDRLASVGGAAYISYLLESDFSERRIREWGEAIVLAKRMREVIRESHTTLTEGYGDHGDPREWLVQREAAMSTACSMTVADERTQLAGPIIREVYADIEDRAKGGHRAGLSTGLADLDRLLNGVRPGNVMTIGARSHIGKSSLARQIAGHVSGFDGSGGPKRGVLLWSGEQPRKECIDCMLFQAAALPAYKASNKDLMRKADWDVLTGAAAAMNMAPLWVNDLPAITPIQLRAEIRKWKKNCAKFPGGAVDPALVVVDYVQLMSAAGLVERGANREREVAKISEKLKELAMSEMVAMIVLAQLNKDGDKRKDRRPHTSDLRESGRLEQDSDKIVLIHNEHAEERMKQIRSGNAFKAPEHELIELIVGKSRGGGMMGTVRVLFYPAHAGFATYTDRGDFPH